MTARRKWTPAAVRQLGRTNVVTDLATLGAILNQGETATREQYHAGTLPEGIVVLKVGRTLKVPVAPILRVLGLDNGGDDDRWAAGDQRGSGPGVQPGQPANGTGGASTDAACLTTVAAPSPRDTTNGHGT